MQNRSTADSRASHPGPLTKQLNTTLKYAGKLSEVKYQEQFTEAHGLTLGRLILLLNILEQFGPSKARAASDIELEYFFNGPLQDDPDSHGVNGGGMAGLTGWSEDGRNTFNSILVDDRRGGRPRLSEIGLAAFKDVALNYIAPGDPTLPDMDALRADLETLRTQLALLNQRVNDRGDGPALIGHNCPPEEDLLGPERADISAAVDNIPGIIAKTDSAEAAKTADPTLLEKTAAHLLSITHGVARVVKNGGANIAKGVAQGMGKEAWENPTAFMQKLEAVAHALAHWAAVLIG
jgi:hypothetical protein